MKKREIYKEKKYYPDQERADSKPIFEPAHWKLYLILVLVTTALYFRSLFFDFVYLDDNSLILENIDFLKNFNNLPQAFLKDVFQADHGLAAYYRPLLTISLMLDAFWGGAEPFIYHLFNILIHLIAIFLVFKLIYKLGYSWRVAFFLATIFAVHPVLTQAVSWVPGRNDSLLTVFVLGAFIFFLNYFREQKIISLLTSFLFFALAVFTKESALLFPLFCLMYLWMRKAISWKKVIVWMAGWVPIIGLWFYFRGLAFAENPMPFALADIFWSVWKNSPAFVQMLGKVFFPFNLSVLPNIPDTVFWWGLLSIVILLAVIFWEYKIGSFSRRRSLMFLFGFFWFGAFLAPSFVRPDPNVIADFIEHRLYLPIIGIMILLAESDWAGGLIDRLKLKQYILLLVGVSFFFGLISFSHQKNFSDKMAFWLNASLNSPSSPLAQRNLGAMYHLDNNLNLAEKYYQKAIELNDLEPMVHANLGLIYASRGSFGPAEREYLKEISFNPGYDNAHFNLGLLYFGMKKYDLAEKEWQKTLEINPNYADARKGLETLKNSR